MNSWKKTTVGEFSPFVYGKGLSKNLRHDGTIPVFGSNGIIGMHNKAITEAQTIIIGRKGTIGSIHFSKFPCWAIDTTYYIEPSNKRDASFTYYLLKTLNLYDLNSDSAVPGLNRDFAHSLDVKVPSLQDQKKIGHILRIFDDKIENLQNLNKNLEQIVKSVFKSWFIDFDGQTEFVDSKLGEIPKGWEIKDIEEVCFTYGGGTPSTKNAEFWSGTINWAIPSDLTKNNQLFLKETERRISEVGLNNCASKLHPLDSILMTSRASIGFFSVNKVPVATNQGFIVIEPKRKIDRYYLLNNFQNRVSEFINNANGTTFLEISRGVFRKLPIVIPTVEVLESFHESVNSVYEKIFINEKMIDYLTKIRDCLLPKLMSGDLRI